MIVEKDFLYKELSYKIVGCFYDVHNDLGPAHKEQIYHEALKIIFKEKNLTCVSKPRLPITFHQQSIGVYEPDFLIEDKIIVELKSIQLIPKVFEKQLYYYIKNTKYKVGYLVNFGNDKLDLRRRVFELARR